MADMERGDVITVVWTDGVASRFFLEHVSEDGTVTMLPDPENPPIPHQPDAGPECRPPVR